MKYSIELKKPSPPEWIECVLNDFGSFLQDHADCERKASAMAMSFVAKCPDKLKIIPSLIDVAIEELEHFQLVYNIMKTKGITLKKEMTEDLYIKTLLKQCKSDKEGRFLDRLLLASVFECRGAERFKLVAESLTDPELKRFYKDLWTSEARHGNIFVKMALEYFDEKRVYERLEHLMVCEGDLIYKLPIKPTLH